MSWDLDRILAAKFQSRMRNISKEQCYVPTKPSDTEEEGFFHEQLDAVCGPISSAVSSLAKHCLNTELARRSIGQLTRNVHLIRSATSR